MNQTSFEVVGDSDRRQEHCVEEDANRSLCGVIVEPNWYGGFWTMRAFEDKLEDSLGELQNLCLSCAVEFRIPRRVHCIAEMRERTMCGITASRISEHDGIGEMLFANPHNNLKSGLLCVGCIRGYCATHPNDRTFDGVFSESV